MLFWILQMLIYMNTFPWGSILRSIQWVRLSLFEMVIICMGLFFSCIYFLYKCLFLQHIVLYFNTFLKATKNITQQYLTLV